MKIAVIGAGNVGAAFTKAAVAAGHSVTVTATSVDKAQQVADAAGATAGTSNASAVAGAELVLLAVPASAVAGLAAELREALAGTTVVDATNPLNASYSDLDIAGTSAAADLQALLPDSAVVKAFNTVFASRYAAPTEDGVALTALLAGDDAEAKATVRQVAESLGFRPLDAGGLRMARALEEMAFLNIVLNASNGWAWQSAWSLVGPTDD